MKKGIVVLVMALLFTGMVGCGGEDSLQLTPTPTATPTPTPTAKPTPTATPTPTPTLKPHILSHTTYFGSLGYFVVVGEVVNRLQSNIGFVEIVATFYDAQKTVIGTDFTFTRLDILKPGQKAPFELSSYPEKISPVFYKLSVSYRKTSEEPFTGLAILTHRARFDSLGYHKIVGEVQNNGVRESTFVKVVCTYYDSGGDMIGTSFTFTNPEDIEAGDTAPFELSSYPRNIEPDHYELQVQGN